MSDATWLPNLVAGTSIWKLGDELNAAGLFDGRLLIPETEGSESLPITVRWELDGLIPLERARVEHADATLVAVRELGAAVARVAEALAAKEGALAAYAEALTLPPLDGAGAAHFFYSPADEKIFVINWGASPRSLVEGAEAALSCDEWLERWGSPRRREIVSGAAPVEDALAGAPSGDGSGERDDAEASVGEAAVDGSAAHPSAAAGDGGDPPALATGSHQPVGSDDGSRQPDGDPQAGDALIDDGGEHRAWWSWPLSALTVTTLCLAGAFFLKASAAPIAPPNAVATAASAETETIDELAAAILESAGHSEAITLEDSAPDDAVADARGDAGDEDAADDADAGDVDTDEGDEGGARDADAGDEDAGNDASSDAAPLGDAEEGPVVSASDDAEGAAADEAFDLAHGPVEVRVGPGGGARTGTYRRHSSEHALRWRITAGADKISRTEQQGNRFDVWVSQGESFEGVRVEWQGAAGIWHAH